MVREGGRRAERAWQAASAVGALLVVAVLFTAVRRGPDAVDDGPRPAFDPNTTDERELRRVSEAVDAVIRSHGIADEAALQGLEAVRAESAGARDLKESCVNTYRSALQATAAMTELQALLGAPDGGERLLATLTPVQRARALALNQTVLATTELMAQSKDRCTGLQEAALRRAQGTPSGRGR